MSQPQQLKCQIFEALGTKIAVVFVLRDNDKELAKVFAAIEKEAERIEEKYSRFLPNSSLAELNENLDQWQLIDEETQTLFNLAADLEDLTDKSFDIGIHDALVNLGYDQKLSFKRSQKSLKKPEDTFCLDDGKVKLLRAIDFGGFGKGYFLDKAKEIAQSLGIKNGLVNAGGDIIAWGSEPNEEGWRVFIEQPVSQTVYLKDQVLCVSSPRLRNWPDENGETLHHIVDPKTLEPAENVGHLALLSTANSSAAILDGLATGLSVNMEKIVSLKPKIAGLISQFFINK
jgi:thiamine biosynthesis lipoprotein